METIIRNYIATLLRNLAAPIIVYLAGTGWISTDEATNFIVAGITIAIAVVWGVLNKYVFNRTIDKALELPAGSSRDRLAE
jgi:hypothetical protein